MHCDVSGHSGIMDALLPSSCFDVDSGLQGMHVVCADACTCWSGCQSCGAPGDCPSGTAQLRIGAHLVCSGGGRSACQEPAWWLHRNPCLRSLTQAEGTARGALVSQEGGSSRGTRGKQHTCRCCRTWHRGRLFPLQHSLP